ncbi:MAG: preprotein translocase subunit YajC [Pseudomonadales bacterium]|jgi:preprotein translocase subunit YajC|nr:preprotein translocase subunit YajC [Cellvibrionales bacterium]MBP8029656.1 preprotein translocase subunit YajC [Pseudomonadales bacterium]
MSFFISEAVAQTAAPAAGSQSNVSMIVMMVGMFVFMYFLIIRPQRKRQKEQEALMSSLNKGDEVVLTSGLLGRIVRVDGDYLVLNTGDNIELKFQRQAVHAVLPKGTIKAI